MIDTLNPEKERDLDVFSHYLALKQHFKKTCHDPRDQQRGQHLPADVQTVMQIMRMMHWTSVFMLVS